MTHGQIHALFAAGKLSPAEAAAKVMAAHAERAKKVKRNPIVLIFLLLIATAASLLGLRGNENA